MVLVEGISDRIAVETLAARLGCNLEGEGVAVVPMGGVQAIGRFLTLFGPPRTNRTVAGLYDIGEEHVVRHALRRAGITSSIPLTRAGMEELGFYACVVDLEDEMIRALGAAIVDAQAELDSFRTLQKQPEWRGQRVEAQLRRFLGNSSRKIRYAPLLIDALDLSRTPQPLHRLLDHVLSST